MSDGPLDLRLVPASAAGWLVCGLGIAAPASKLSAAAAVVLVVALVVVVVLMVAGLPRAAGGTILLLLAVVVAALASCAAQVAVRDGGILGSALRERAVATVEGTVAAEVVVAPSVGPGSGHGSAPARVRTVLAVQRVVAHGRAGTASAPVMVTGGAEWAGVEYGSRVRVSGRLASVPAGDAMEGALTTWGPVEVLDGPGQIDAAVDALRSSLMAASDHLPPDGRGLVPGAAIGDVSRVPDDLTAAMRTVGLTHVTAVSGSHFALLAGAVLSVTGALRLPRAARAGVTTLTIGALVLLVHPQPSVVRAAVMGVVGCIGLLVGRRANAVSGLCVAVILLLVLDPWLSRSLGFVLSVVATAAIVLLGPRLADALARWLPRWLADGLAVPVAAQVACAPVVVLISPAVSIYAIPANLLAAPALVPTTLLGVAATLVAGWWPAAGRLLCNGAGAAAWWVASVARTGAAMPGATLPWHDHLLGAVALLALDAAAVVALLGGGRLRRERRPGLLLVTAALAVLLLPGSRFLLVALLARA